MEDKNQTSSEQGLPTIDELSNVGRLHFEILECIKEDPPPYWTPRLRLKPQQPIITFDLERISTLLKSYKTDLEVQEETPPSIFPQLTHEEGSVLARRSFSEAVSMISDFLDPELITTARQLGDEDNVRFVLGGYGWTIDLRDIDEQRTVPLNKEISKYNVFIDIGSGLAEQLGSTFLEAANKNGIDLSPQQALELGFLVQSAHEFSHLIDSALKIYGFNSFERSRGLSAFFPLLSETDYEGMHEERLASSVALYVLKKTLTRLVGDKGMILVKDFLKYNQHELRWFYYLYERLNQLKIPPSEVHLISIHLKKHLQEQGFPNSDLVPDVMWREVGYLLPPYSEEQLRKLLALE